MGNINEIRTTRDFAAYTSRYSEVLQSKYPADIILYHGSRGGLDGPIRPCSRVKCDFGRGFYMGTNQIQAMGLVAEDAAPIIYTLRVNRETFHNNNVLILDGMEWAYAVLACRGRVNRFSNINIIKDLVDRINASDFVVGPIADDRMNEAMRRFQMNALTDKGLMACLASVDYGIQIVAKSDKACNAIEIVTEREILDNEMGDIRRYTADKRNEGKTVVEDMAIKFARDGKYLFEIMQENAISNHLYKDRLERDDYDER